MYVVLLVIISNIYVLHCVHDLEQLKDSKTSLPLEVDQFLQNVTDKFSEVLLPVKSITKQGLLGKGYRKEPYMAVISII